MPFHTLHNIADQNDLDSQLCENEFIENEELDDLPEELARFWGSRTVS